MATGDTVRVKPARKGGAKPQDTTTAMLTPDPQNANKGTPRGLGMLEESITRYGLGRGIVVDKHGVVIGGNKTLEVAVERGLVKTRIVKTRGDELVVTQREDLDLSDPTNPARMMAYADNRVSEVSLLWNIEQLAADQAAGLDLKPFFFAEELKAILLPAGGTAGLTDPDDVPTERATGIVAGDLFDLGPHRLLCGDCTVQGDVLRLCGNERAGLMNTDPPYGIAYQNEDLHPDAGPIRKRVKNDDKEGAAIQPFLEAAFGAAKAGALKPDAGWYLWHGMLTQGFFAAAAAAAAANVVLHRQIIWVKPVLVFGRGQYHWKHELCFMGWVEGHQPPDYGLGKGERTQTTVWAVDSVTHADRKTFNHSTPKPVELFTVPIVKHLLVDEIAYEPFAGSGPQVIAAEQTGRRCFAMELEPAHCQVIIDRWEAFTGQKATKVGEVVRA